MYEQILKDLPPTYQNNARSIVMNYIKRYAETKSPYFARKVFEMTGSYPDGLNSWGLSSDAYINNELDFINVPNMIY